eukprot:gene8769-9671_t
MPSSTCRMRMSMTTASSQDSVLHIQRRLTSAVAAGLIAFNALSMPVLAGVGDGGLPDGVLAFSKILKYQKDWASLSDAIQSRGSEFSDREVLDTKAFLRALGSEYDDMILLTRGILDPAKANDAKAIAADFRRTIRQCESAINQRDVAKVMELYSKSATMLDTFLTLLHDVPDEL